MQCLITSPNGVSWMTFDLLLVKWVEMEIEPWVAKESLYGTVFSSVLELWNRSLLLPEAQSPHSDTPTARQRIAFGVQPGMHFIVWEQTAILIIHKATIPSSFMQLAYWLFSRLLILFKTGNNNFLILFRDGKTKIRWRFYKWRLTPIVCLFGLHHVHVHTRMNFMCVRWLVFLRRPMGTEELNINKEMKTKPPLEWYKWNETKKLKGIPEWIHLITNGQNKTRLIGFFLLLLLFVSM